MDDLDSARTQGNCGVRDGLLAEEEFEVVDPERGEGFGGFFDEVVEERALAFVQLQDAFLDGVAHHEPDAVHASGLADAVGAVGCLVLDRGIPPRIEEDHGVRRGEVEPFAILA